MCSIETRAKHYAGSNRDHQLDGGLTLALHVLKSDWDSAESPDAPHVSEAT